MDKPFISEGEMINDYFLLLDLPRTGVPVESDARGFLFESPRDSRPPSS